MTPNRVELPVGALVRDDKSGEIEFWYRGKAYVHSFATFNNDPADVEQALAILRGMPQSLMNQFGEGETE